MHGLDYVDVPLQPEYKQIELQGSSIRFRAACSDAPNN